MTPEPKQDIMTAESLSETIFQQYVKAPNATAMPFSDMRKLIDSYTQSIRTQCAEEARELVSLIKKSEVINRGGRFVAIPYGDLTEAIAKFDKPKGDV